MGEKKKKIPKIINSINIPTTFSNTQLFLFT